MTDVQAALGLGQLARLDALVAARAAAWERYDALLQDLDVELPPTGSGHARHLYRVAVADRDRVAQELRAAAIGTGVHYRAVHLHPYYARDPAELPHATRMSETTLSLPLDAALTEDDQLAVAAALRGAIARGNSGSGSAAFSAAQRR